MMDLEKYMFFSFFFWWGLWVKAERKEEGGE